MAEFGRWYPGCWKQLENFALARGQDGLPEWGICLESQSRWFNGVFVALEHNANDGHRKLQLVFVADEDSVSPVFVHLVPGTNTEQAIDEALKYAAKQLSGQDKKLMKVKDGKIVSARRILEIEIPESDNSYLEPEKYGLSHITTQSPHGGPMMISRTVLIVERIVAIGSYRVVPRVRDTVPPTVLPRCGHSPRIRTDIKQNRY
ncbi:hypothetical protein HNR65_001835 [Desulfosalsimonas propionicica]|uniref:Uncharacterized protein n=1 Tax=Desulfosalsimonas propionicica TaxID=332175 RepID=A0A7W0HKS4_9BACT|nr:hypothetical protein [Desulfosalsimonas propionicica]MBA2881508.1 hypothetical protein [Desulfosalsimonas propionicica]